jgi:putative ABC transport system permease protein
VYVCTGIAYPGTPFLVRTSADPAAIAGAVRRTMTEAEPRRAVYAFTPLDDHLSASRSGERSLTVLFTIFGATALLLSGLGVYGTLSHAVGTRRREVGLMLALGAERGRILRRFLYLGLGVTLAGSVAGLALALATGRTLESMLYGIAPSDMTTQAAVLLIVVGTAIGAALVPSYRASRVDPVEVLREE